MLDVKHRLDLADLANELGLDTAVEVGTHRADFAVAFLSRFRGSLLCVDPYLNYPGEEKLWPSQPSRTAARDRQDDYRAARAALEPFGVRATLVRMASVEAAAYCRSSWKIDPGLVYLDGDHRPEHVAADIAAWWPLVAPGGVLAGHDWRSGPGDGPQANQWPGVSVAVRAFAEPLGLAIRLTSDWPSSWWVAKPVRAG